MPVPTAGPRGRHPAALFRTQVDAVAMGKCPQNPSGMGFTARETDLTSTREAQRDCDFNAARVWKVRARARCHTMP